MPIETSTAQPSATTVPPIHDTDGRHWRLSNESLYIIIVCSVVGGLLLVSMVLCIWRCAKRRKRVIPNVESSPVPDEREFEKWRLSGKQDSISDFDSKSERLSTSQRQSEERFYSVARPTPSHQPVPPLPTATSASGILHDADPLDDGYEHSDVPALVYPSSEVLTPSPAQYGGGVPSSEVLAPSPAQYRGGVRRSTQSLKGRPQTPLFGNGKVAGEAKSGKRVNSREVTPTRSVPASPLARSLITRGLTEKR